MGSPASGSIHEIIQLAHALRSGGLTDEVMQALLVTPAIAQAAAQAAMDAHQRLEEASQPSV